MGVYIKGIKMPKDEPLLMKINPDGTVSTTARNNYKKYEAVELPTHGRLIDADALLSAYNGDIWTAQTDYAEGLRDAAEDIKTAPTIIPAEEGEG